METNDTGVLIVENEKDVIPVYSVRGFYPLRRRKP